MSEELVSAGARRAVEELAAHTWRPIFISQVLQAPVKRSCFFGGFVAPPASSWVTVCMCGGHTEKCRSSLMHV